MPFLSNAIGFLRFASGLKAFLRQPISVEAAKAIIREKMQRRDASFLQIVERAVFANPQSPYLKLFRASGCELGDVMTMVQREGVEGTLDRLHQAGIFVTFEEFKGRTPAVRGSQTFAFRDTDFDNPLISTHFRSSSGGTRGRPTRINIDLDHIAQSAPPWALWFAAHGLMGTPLVFWTSTHSGIASAQLRCAKFGQKMVQMFATASMGTVKDRMISASVLHLVQRAAGLPKPEFVPLSEAWKVGEYLVKMVQDGMKPCVNLAPSAAVRISLAMQERGASLQNVTFLLRGEPLTQARRETIETTGAKAVQTYGFSEGGPVASQCPTPTAVDDVHIFLDAFAVISRARSIGDGRTVDALLFTSLRPAASKIMLNTEIGDYGVLETKRCGCLFDPASEEYRKMEHEQIQEMLPKFIKDERPDLIFIGRESFALHVPDIARAHSIPNILGVRGNTTIAILNKTYPDALAEEMLEQYRKADLLISAAKHMADGLKELGFNNIMLIPNAIDLDQFTPKPKDASLLGELNIRDDEIIVVHVSNLKLVKRPLDVVASAERALEQNPKLVYVIVGDGAYRQAMEDACRQKHISERFRFAGWVEYSRVPDYINLADMVVMPSATEGLARVYLETQACARLLLASDIAPAHEVIVDGDLIVRA